MTSKSDAVKLDRPWQVPITVNPATCPFAPGNLKEEEVIWRYHKGTWILIKNIFTPFNFHRMLIPKECWPLEKLQRLGGLQEIIAALKIATDEVAKSGREFIHVGVHSGSLAGQNISHLHYHIVDMRDKKDISRIVTFEQFSLSNLRSTVERDARIIFHHENVTVVAGGCRAGQCYFFVDGAFTVTSLAEALDRLITLYAEKFKSKQGLPPDYCVGLTFTGGVFHHAVAVPILNNWGTIQYSALYGGGVVVLPWSHEVTASYLRSDI